MRAKSEIGIRQSAIAFTLVELLVVVSIIALLLGILLPALGRARAIAQSTVCLAHLRGAGLGMITYATDNNGWIAGPNTSGWEFNDNTHIFQNYPTEPTQNFDWISPTMATSLGLPGNYADKMTEILDSQFRCPANKEKYNAPIFGDPIPGMVPTDHFVSSYSAAIAHMIVPGPSVEPGLEGLGFIAQRTSGDSATTGNFLLPYGYRPNMSKMKRPADKAMVMDGSRFIDVGTVGSVAVSFNSLIKQIAGGNFGTVGPVVVLKGDPYLRKGSVLVPNKDLTLDPVAIRYAYRHPQNSMNLVFYDGHAANVSDRDSLNSTWYLPTGTTMVGTRNYDPNATAGMIVP